MHIKLGYIKKSASKIKYINKVITGTARELRSIISSDEYPRKKKRKKVCNVFVQWKDNRIRI